MKVKDEATNILADSIIKDGMLYLPNRQLNRKLYLDVNKVLEAIGGNRKLYLDVNKVLEAIGGKWKKVCVVYVNKDGGSSGKEIQRETNKSGDVHI